MGAIEDTRKVLQDFLAPEIREVKTRLDALETRIDERFDHAEKLETQRFEQVTQRFEQADRLQNERFDRVAQRFGEVDRRFDEADRRAEERHQALMASISQLANFNKGLADEFHSRLTHLEAKERPHQ